MITSREAKQLSAEITDAIKVLNHAIHNGAKKGVQTRLFISGSVVDNPAGCITSCAVLVDPDQLCEDPPLTNSTS